jgi:hypothetical protein
MEFEAQRQKSVRFVMLVTLFGLSGMTLWSGEPLIAVGAYSLVVYLFLTSPFNRLLQSRRVIVRLLLAQAFFLLLAVVPKSNPYQPALVVVLTPLMFYVCFWRVKPDIKALL